MVRRGVDSCAPDLMKGRGFLLSAQRRRPAARRLGLWSPHPGRVRPWRGPWRWLPGALAVIGLLLVWWVAAQFSLVSPVVLPNPVAVACRVVEWATSGVIWSYLWPTVGEALLGLVLAGIVALPLGYGMAHSRLLAAVAEPFVAFSQTIPLVAVAPLLVLWIGYGTWPIAVLCAVVAFFPMLTTTVVGLRGIDGRIIEHAMLDGASAPQRLWHVEMPVAGPAVLAGVRAGGILAMTGAIVGEFVMGGTGLGTLLTISRQGADVVGVFTVLVWIALVALVFQAVIQIAERAATVRLQGEAS